ncbi:MAG: ATP-dependent helicase [Burkholderiales bacterium]|nr:ATP-dependent helicase [Burkholderiales bacterium]
MIAADAHVALADGTRSPAAPYLAELNPAQYRAVTFGIDADAGQARSAPLLVIAGAGTGKTKTLTHRVAHLIVNGARPERVLLLTFARRMAQEMTRRVEQICARCASGLAPGSIEWSGTFHAVGAKLLRLHAEQIGLDPAFSILDRSDAEDLIDLVRDDLGLSRVRSRFPRKSTCLAIYSHSVNARKAMADTLDASFPWCSQWRAELGRLFAAYVEAKQARNALDYDDLLLYWARMMAVPQIARAVAERFDHVLVDEYQDTNALQAAILLGLSPRGEGLTVVGDDAQAIYSFRSATVRNILDYPAQFDPPAAVLKLERNYRSSSAILEACNRIIGRAAEGYGKRLYSLRQDGAKPVLAVVSDETAQVDFVVERVLANREQGMALREQAILVRASHHSSRLEVELSRRNIPFVKFGGLKFLEAAHVKDVLAVLRWANNPKDEVAALRVLKLVPGIGPAAARRIFGRIQDARGFLAGVHDEASAKTAVPLDALMGLLRALGTSASWHAELDQVRRWYDPLLESRYDNALTRRGDLDQLGSIAASHASRTAFLTEITLDPPQACGAHAGPPLKDEDWLVVSTIHSAKGQEWKSVMILNVVDGCIPSDLATGSADEIEEERRLLYVAMTRAREDLVLLQPVRFAVRGQTPGGDRHVYAPRSRFIGDADLDAFDLVRPSAGAGFDPGAAPQERALAVDLKAVMREMWSY